MNKTLQKKLLSYSTLATALLAIERHADAQIIYHQVDTTTTNYLFDLNGDGVYDFDISCNFNSTSYTTISGRSIVNTHLTARVYAYNSNLINGKIRQSGVIAGSNTANSFFSPPIYPDTSGYIALKLRSNNKTYMGWVRFSVTAYEQGVTIIGYAYNLTPTSHITLGDSGCANSPNTPSVSLYGTDTLISTSSKKYQWCLNGVPLQNDTSQTLLNPPHGYYSVITTDTEGCKTQSSAVNYSKCGTMGSNLLIYTPQEFQDCKNVNLEPQLSYIPPYQFDSISWYINGQLFDTTATPLYSFSKTIQVTSGFYAVGYNSFTHCHDTSNIVIDTIYPQEPPPVIVQHGDTLFAIDSAKESYYYGWYDSTQQYAPIYSDTDYYIPDSTGTYLVSIDNVNGCESTSLPYYYTKTGINVLSINDIIKVYTNDDNIYINFLNSDFLNGTIELYNIEGQKLQEQTITNNTEILNAQQYAKGIYFVAITKNGVRKVYKVALL